MPPNDARVPARVGTRLGRVGGVAIFLTPTWPVSLAIVLVVVALLGGRVLPDPSPLAVTVSAVVLTGLLMLGVLLHELGHLFAARAVGQRVLRIRFDVLGGQTDLIGPATTAGRDAFVAVAGPLASALFSAAGFGVAQAFDPGSSGRLLAMTVGVVNALLTVFNLLPALPLDGGEVVRTLAWRISGDRRIGTRVGFVCTAVVAAGLLVVAVVRWSAGDVGRMHGVILGAMALHLGASGFAEWRGERRAWSAVTRPSQGSVAAGTTPGTAVTGSHGAAEAVPSAGTGTGPAPAARSTVVPDRGTAPRSIAALPADATVAAATATGMAVALVDPEGVPVAIAGPERWAGVDPNIPLLDIAAPHSPLAILLADDGPVEIARALRRLPDTQYFLVADDQGDLFGVWTRAVLTLILASGDRQTGRQTDGRAPGPGEESR